MHEARGEGKQPDETEQHGQRRDDHCVYEAAERAGAGLVIDMEEMGDEAEDNLL